VSLGTKDCAEARRKAPEALAQIDAWQAAAVAASQPVRALSFKEIMAECGVWYREMLADHEDDPGSATGWEVWADLLRDRLDVDENGHAGDFIPLRGDLEEAQRILRSRGIPADPDSIRGFAIALHHTKFRVTQVLKMRAEGNYAPDPTLETFPTPPDRNPPQRKGRPTLPAEDLVKAWAAERNPSEATLTKYRRTFRHLARILGFDDVRRITPEDVVTFKQARAAEKIDPGTIADDVLAAGTVCNWATKNKMLTTNPFAGLAPKVLRRGPARREPYTDDEAKRILLAARSETGWLRWGPWLLAFTGARVSEFADMRRGDVRQEGGIWIFDVRPIGVREGKTDNFQRMIPIHPAIIAEGFLDYVDGLPATPSGPLFPSLSPDPSGSRTIPGTSKMGRWIRGAKVGIKDPKKAPNHSWRHRIEDELRKVRALPEVQDAITGRYNPRNAGDGYGKGFRGMPDQVLADLRKIPSPLSKGTE
jgi:integrase